MINIGKKIKEAREKERLTQNDLALKCGISRVSITRYENGTRTPDYMSIYAIANALKVSISELFEEENFDVTLTYDTDNNFYLNISDSKGGHASIDMDEEDAEEIAEKLDLSLEKIPF